MNKQRVVAGREIQDVTQFINKMSIGKPYEVVNYTETRNLNGNAVALADLANVVATLVVDLKAKGIIQEN